MTLTLNEKNSFKNNNNMNNRLLDEFGVNNIFILHETKLIDEMRTGIISNLIEHVLTTKNFPKILICVDHPNL